MKNIQQYIDNGYVSKRKHPEYDLWILNYTQSCQFEKVWNETTLQCRGLIVDEDYNIIARSFPKFFNWEEHDEVNLVEPVTVTIKMDGSLVICYHHNGKWNFATRGSFESDQAKAAEKLWNEKYKHLEAHMEPGLSYLFEFTGNRTTKVVVNYDKEQLTLLTIYNGDSEIDIFSDVFSIFPIVKRYSVDDKGYYSHLKSLNTENSEGFVLRDATGFRVKIKFEDYIRLHRLLTGVTEKRVWELLKENTPLDDYLRNVPEEFEKWFLETKESLEEQFAYIESESRNWLEYIETYTGTRKEFALEVQKLCNYPSVVFNMADGKDYTQIIWKILKPESENQFKINLGE